MSVQSDDTCKVLYVIEKAQDPREILSRTCWNATENFPWGVGWPPFLPSPGEVTELPTPESEAPGADVSTSFMTKESQSFGVSPLSFSSNTCQKLRFSQWRGASVRTDDRRNASATLPTAVGYFFPLNTPNTGLTIFCLGTRGFFSHKRDGMLRGVDVSTRSKSGLIDRMTPPIHLMTQK